MEDVLEIPSLVANNKPVTFLDQGLEGQAIPLWCIALVKPRVLRLSGLYTETAGKRLISTS